MQQSRRLRGKSAGSAAETNEGTFWREIPNKTAVSFRAHFPPLARLRPSSLPLRCAATLVAHCGRCAAPRCRLAPSFALTWPTAQRGASLFPSFVFSRASPLLASGRHFPRTCTVMMASAGQMTPEAVNSLIARTFKTNGLTLCR